MLRESGYNNYTIIRPYITYSSSRLQLGVYEKENWLYRILNGKPIVITKDILDKKTTLTYGLDVATGIFNLLDKDCPNGDVVHITTEEYITWREVLDIYSNTIHEETGQNAEVYVSDDIGEIENLWEGSYNTKYDRLYDRKFSNKNAERLCGHIDYMPVKQGLSSCLKDFISRWKKSPEKSFLEINWEYEAYADLILDCIDDLSKVSDVYVQIVTDRKYEFLKKRRVEKIYFN